MTKHTIFASTNFLASTDFQSVEALPGPTSVDVGNRRKFDDVLMFCIDASIELRAKVGYLRVVPLLSINGFVNNRSTIK
jgi:formylmethanofuran dehydrogenase subunit B